LTHHSIVLVVDHFKAAIDMIHRSGGIFGATATSREVLRVLQKLEEKDVASAPQSKKAKTEKSKK
jgi:hypothetical protein